MRFFLAELLCIVLIAAGLWLWVAPGAGLVAAGVLGLVLAVAAQMPTQARAGDG